MSKAFNTYVRNGSIERCTDGSYRCTMLFGQKVFDPQAMFHPHCIPAHLMGQPREMVLHIAGETYYPTTHGYVRV